MTPFRSRRLRFLPEDITDGELWELAGLLQRMGEAPLHVVVGQIITEGLASPDCTQADANRWRSFQEKFASLIGDRGDGEG